MKVILINGSPNAKGCTYTALEEVSKTLKSEGIETEIIHVGHKDIRGCIGCRQCKTKGKCVFNDIVNDIAPKFKECDGIVIGPLANIGIWYMVIHQKKYSRTLKDYKR